MSPLSQPFPETRWSLVLRAAGDGAEGERGQRALEELCRDYWFPIYAFARRAGRAPADAEDLTQGFFALLLSRQLLAKADPNRGRLRSFLIGAFKLHLSDESRREQRLRRGGGQTILSLEQAEEWFEAGADDGGAAEERFDRDWAESAVAQALEALAVECEERGKGAQFARLREFLSWDQGEPEVAAAARTLGLSEGALRVTVHRLRRRFRDLLEAQIAETVASPGELQAELEHLFRSLLRE